MAEVEAFRDDLAGRFRDKYRQPVHHAEGHIEESPVGMEAVAFHEEHPMRPAAEWETCGRAERRDRETRAEREARSVALGLLSPQLTATKPGLRPRSASAAGAARNV